MPENRRAARSRPHYQFVPDFANADLDSVNWKRLLLKVVPLNAQKQQAQTLRLGGNPLSLEGAMELQTCVRRALQRYCRAPLRRGPVSKAPNILDRMWAKKWNPMRDPKTLKQDFTVLGRPAFAGSVALDVEGQPRALFGDLQDSWKHTLKGMFEELNTRRQPGDLWFSEDGSVAPHKNSFRDLLDCRALRGSGGRRCGTYFFQIRDDQRHCSESCRKRASYRKIRQRAHDRSALDG